MWIWIARFGFLLIIFREVSCEAPWATAAKAISCTKCKESGPVTAGCVKDNPPESSCHQNYCGAIIFAIESGALSLFQGCPYIMTIPYRQNTNSPGKPNLMDCYFNELPYQCDCTYDYCNSLNYKQIMKLKYAHDRDATNIPQWRLDRSTVEEFLAEPDIPMPLGNQTIPFETTSAPLTFDPIQQEKNNNALASERGGDAPAAVGKKDKNITAEVTPKPEETTGLSTTMIAAIIGVVVLIILIVGIILYRINANKKKKKKRVEDEEEEGEEDEEEA